MSQTTPHAESEQPVLVRLRKRRVFTTKHLMELLGCSIATVGRRVKEWGVHTSYNMNGGYYALRNVPQFDEYGIWECKGALFSRYGNLKETLNHLVSGSESGLSTIELGKILRLLPHTIQSVLSACREEISTRRQRFKGLNIYFSNQPKVYKAQCSAREESLEQAVYLDMPSDSDSIIIFVELIKHPEEDCDLLVRRVRRRGLTISIEKVRNLLLYHGIEKKKLRAQVGKKS